VLWIGLGHYGVEVVLKTESFPIDKIYVPLKTRKTLKSEVVQEIAESILEIGQQAPILVRPDEDRFVLVEGLHRLEACKALGEKTIIGLLVSAEVARQKTLLPHNAEVEAERQKMARLRKLRLEKEAVEKLAVASRAVMETESAVLLRERPEKYIQNNLKATPSQLARRTSRSTPRTSSESPRQFQRAKPRPKTNAARRVTLSDEEKAKYEELTRQRAERDKSYGRHIPADSPKR
jgi:uncharacterized ParB-like nuclease family protein